MGAKLSKLSKIPLKLKKKSESSIMSKLSTSSFQSSQSSQSSQSQSQSLFSSRDNTTLTTLEDKNPLFKFEDGRRYINDDSIRYPLPNDDEEIDRLQLQHYLLRYIWQSNFSAPVKEILNCGAEVLDLGCGPGTWILEMASDYPLSNFTGIDIAPIFHMRLMLAVLHEDEWKDVVLPEIFRILKPGGYIESHEFDFRIVNQGPCMKKLVDGFIQCCKRRNMDPIVCPHIPGYLHENNFVNIRILKNSGHFSSSSGRFGVLALEDFVMLFKTLKSSMSSILEMSEEVYLNLVDQLEEEVDINKTYYEVYRFIARKPF